MSSRSATQQLFRSTSNSDLTARLSVAFDAYKAAGADVRRSTASEQQSERGRLSGEHTPGRRSSVRISDRIEHHVYEHPQEDGSQVNSPRYSGLFPRGERPSMSSGQNGEGMHPDAEVTAAAPEPLGSRMESLRMHGSEATNGHAGPGVGGSRLSSGDRPQRGSVAPESRHSILDVDSRPPPSPRRSTRDRMEESFQRVETLGRTALATDMQQRLAERDAYIQRLETTCEQLTHRFVHAPSCLFA
jgi:hypothetical protein